MVEKIVTPSLDVIDFLAYRQRASLSTQPSGTSRRICSHCGALMFEDESEDECSSLDAGSGSRFRATGV
ncbi:MAG: hypothetical protein WBA48_14090 [Xanthobacteraceae bacterium]